MGRTQSRFEILDSYKLWMNGWHIEKGKGREAELDEKAVSGHREWHLRAPGSAGQALERCRVSEGED